VYRAVDYGAGREPGHGGARAYAEVPADDTRAGVGDGGPGQDRVTSGRPETYRGGRGNGRLTEDKRGYGYGADDHGARRQQERADMPGRGTTAADILHVHVLSTMDFRGRIGVIGGHWGSLGVIELQL